MLISAFSLRPLLVLVGQCMTLAAWQRRDQSAAQTLVKEQTLFIFFSAYIDEEQIAGWCNTHRGGLRHICIFSWRKVTLCLSVAL